MRPMTTNKVYLVGLEVPAKPGVLEVARGLARHVPRPRLEVLHRERRRARAVVRDRDGAVPEARGDGRLPPL
jgi:hypothetical protein